MTAKRIDETGARDLGSTLPIREVLLALGVTAGLLIVAWQCGRYLFLGAYIDHIEGNVVISGWQYVHGTPLYAISDGAPLFATYYGPLAYLLVTPALFLFGAGVAASKLTSLLALTSTVAVLAWRFRPSGGNRALDALLIVVAGLVFFSPVTYWVRPDPLEVLLVALAVVSAKSRWNVASLGICIGLAVNLKVHAFLYFLPCVVELWSSHGWRAVARMAALALVAFLLPFLAPGISLHDYVTTLATQIGHRASTHTVQPFIRVAPLIGPPGILIVVALASAASRTARHERLYFCTVLTTLALLIYPATFPGAGIYHLLPFTPVLADAFSRMRVDNFAARWAPLVLLVGSLPDGFASLRMMDNAEAWGPVADEAAALARQFAPQAVQVGYGDNERSYQISQLSKAELALDGHPAVIDAQVLMELRYIGIDASARWLPDLASCRIGRWLLPKGEQPFALISYYYDGAPLFSAEFRSAFLEHYKLSGSSDHFDAWTCANGGAQ